jgi:hypothetical protein
MRNPRAGGIIYNWTLGWFRTAHTIAHRFQHPAVLEYLMNVSPADWKLVAACEIGDEATVRSLRGTAPRPGHHVRLGYAARGNDAAVVRLMLESGWPAGVADSDGVTPLHWAAFHGNAAMAADLLQHGAPRDVQDRNHHSTPLGWAEYGSEHGWYRDAGDYPAVIAALSR